MQRLPHRAVPYEEVVVAAGLPPPRPVENGRIAPPLTFTLTASDPPGLYRVVATIRDLNARRTQRPERIFSLRIE